MTTKNWPKKRVDRVLVLFRGHALDNYRQHIIFEYTDGTAKAHTNVTQASYFRFCTWLESRFHDHSRNYDPSDGYLVVLYNR